MMKIINKTQFLVDKILSLISVENDDRYTEYKYICEVDVFTYDGLKVDISMYFSHIPKIGDKMYWFNSELKYSFILNDDEFILCK